MSKNRICAVHVLYECCLHGNLLATSSYLWIRLWTAFWYYTHVVIHGPPRNKKNATSSPYTILPESLPQLVMQDCCLTPEPLELLISSDTPRSPLNFAWNGKASPNGDRRSPIPRGRSQFLVQLEGNAGVSPLQPEGMPCQLEENKKNHSREALVQVRRSNFPVQPQCSSHLQATALQRRQFHLPPISEVSSVPVPPFSHQEANQTPRWTATLALSLVLGKKCSARPQAGRGVLVSRRDFPSEVGDVSSLPQRWWWYFVGACWLPSVGGCGPASRLRSGLSPPPPRRFTMWWCRAGVWSGAPWPPCWVRLWPSRPIRAVPQVPRPGPLPSPRGQQSRPHSRRWSLPPYPCHWTVRSRRYSGLSHRVLWVQQVSGFVSRCPGCLTSCTKNCELGVYPEPSCFSVWSITNVYKSTLIINRQWDNYVVTVEDLEDPVRLADTDEPCLTYMCVYIYMLMQPLL